MWYGCNFITLNLQSSTDQAWRHLTHISCYGNFGCLETILYLETSEEVFHLKIEIMQVLILVIKLSSLPKNEICTPLPCYQ